MEILSILLPFLFIICAFNHTGKGNDTDTAAMQFNPGKWKIKEGNDYPYRDKMISFLLTNDILKKLKKGEVLQFLGQPDRVDSSYLFYEIAQKRFGSFILHSKTLVVKLKADSTVEWRKLHE